MSETAEDSEKNFVEVDIHHVNEADLNTSLESTELNEEEKKAHEADTLPIDGPGPPPQKKTRREKLVESARGKLRPFSAKHAQLPSDPNFVDRLKHSLLCPPHGYVAWLLTMTFVILALWGVAFSMFGQIAAPPNGTVFILIILVVTGMIFGWLISLLRLPALLGMLIMGIIIKSIPGLEFDGYWDDWSSTLRGAALVVILMRAGLGLDPVALRRLSGMVIRLAFCPCLAETLTVAIASHFILDFPWLWGFMLGFVLAAVSPAVVVPCLLHLQEQGYGVAKGIPTLVIAAASIDDVLAISGFTIILGITFKEQGDLVAIIFQGPLEAIAGLFFGVAWGFLSIIIPGYDDNNKSFFRICILFGGGLLALFGSKVVQLPGAGALAVLVMAFVAGVGWRRQGWDDNNPVAGTLAKFWIIFQPLLFGLIGTEIKVDQLESSTVGLGIAVLFIGLTVRIFVSYFAVWGGNLNHKERLFVALAWLPKATVQAAIGPLAYDNAKRLDPNLRENAEELQELGLKVLTIAVLVILITAPIGAIAIMLSAPKLLTKDEPKKEDHEA